MELSRFIGRAKESQRITRRRRRAGAVFLAFWCGPGVEWPFGLGVADIPTYLCDAVAVQPPLGLGLAASLEEHSRPGQLLHKSSSRKSQERNGSGEDKNKSSSRAFPRASLFLTPAGSCDKGLSRNLIDCRFKRRL